ncbi:hypothetical protein EYF80_041652 [Liparis tanakae]|uniref:Uncharacterized protein n=1 Tax=Liparis tanakae TaxID=230148 RepID=A0A4Z2G5T1_9TELE|nr:hypothetical protein EYF80_041652 [Liparis tanakae]
MAAAQRWIYMRAKGRTTPKKYHFAPDDSPQANLAIFVPGGNAVVLRVGGRYGGARTPLPKPVAAGLELTSLSTAERSWASTN